MERNVSYAWSVSETAQKTHYDNRNLRRSMNCDQPVTGACCRGDEKRYRYIMIDESMILSEPDDTHLTVFNPDLQLLELIRKMASGEGLFVWKPAF